MWFVPLASKRVLTTVNGINVIVAKQRAEEPQNSATNELSAREPRVFRVWIEKTDQIQRRILRRSVTMHMIEYSVVYV